MAYLDEIIFSNDVFHSNSGSLGLAVGQVVGNFTTTLLSKLGLFLFGHFESLDAQTKIRLQFVVVGRHDDSKGVVGGDD